MVKIVKRVAKHVDSVRVFILRSPDHIDYGTWHKTLLWGPSSGEETYVRRAPRADSRTDEHAQVQDCTNIYIMIIITLIIT